VWSSCPRKPTSSFWVPSESAKPIWPPPWATPPARRDTPFSLPMPSASSTTSPPPKNEDCSNANSRNIWPRSSCYWTNWDTCRSPPGLSIRRRRNFKPPVFHHVRAAAHSMEQFLSCHRHAFEFFQGASEKVVIDNLKVGVLRHPSGEKALFHPRYLDLAAHYGFQPVACNVRKANEKGRVENGVGYVKKNFLNGLDIPSFAAVNPAAVQWRDTVANVRIHGETHRKPIDLFADEQPRLKPLPIMPYDCAVVRPI